MITSLCCITGKIRVKEGNWCQDCNGYHFNEDGEVSNMRRGVRTVAEMLHNDEIERMEASMALFLLTQESEIQKNHKHD